MRLWQSAETLTRRGERADVIRFCKDIQGAGSHSLGAEPVVVVFWYRRILTCVMRRTTSTVVDGSCRTGLRW